MRPSLRQISPFILELYWAETPSDALLEQLLSWELAIKTQFGTEVRETRKGFQTLSYLMKNQLNPDAMKTWSRFLESSIEPCPLANTLWEIPVCYDPEMGKDLIELSKSISLDPEKLIALHSIPIYRIHFFGFLPGFMYLNGLDPQLHCPRKSVPDRKIDPGSVAIGGAQTGIYPTESPGGWHVIGKTPIPLFDQNLIPPVFAKPGEQIRFYQISKNEFNQISKYPKPLKSHD
jgi:inhibitor of KinA